LQKILPQEPTNVYLDTTTIKPQGRVKNFYGTLTTSHEKFNIFLMMGTDIYRTQNTAKHAISSEKSFLGRGTALTS